jgi:hAT family C-terminal dimerisation region
MSSFDKMAQSARFRLDGPATRRVRVFHSQPVHFLAATLNPAQFVPTKMGIYLPGAEIAVEILFLRYPAVFSKAEVTSKSDVDRLGILIGQIGSHVQRSRSFAQGTGHRGINCQQLGGGVAWWQMFGVDYPQLSSITGIVLSLSPSSCSAERCFSQQKNIHTLMRSRLDHCKVNKLIFLYRNLRLLSNLPLDVDDTFNSVCDVEEDGRGAGGSRSTEDEDKVHLVSEVLAMARADRANDTGNDNDVDDDDDEEDW